MAAEKVRGMLALDELKAKVEAGEIETIVTVFPDLYGRLMGKRIAGDYFLQFVAEHGMHACDYLFTVEMEMDPVPGYKYANWELGYGDFHCVPDLNTLRVASWLDKAAFVICDSYEEETNTLTPVAPRSILRKQLQNAAAMGYGALGASELEYYIFNETYTSARDKHYADLKTIGAYIEDYHILQGGREEPLNAAARKHLSASGVPVEFSKGEWGPGQHEMNVRYADVLTMTDRHTVFKQCFKDLADSLGIAVTFMAKFDARYAGSSCHIHMSLWDETLTTPIFPGDTPIGPDDHMPCASDEFFYFLGGCIAHAKEVMPFLAPTINSYKRYQLGSWAPTALAWSYDNRTAGFRVVGHGKSLRIECRIPGADTNQYLAYAAMLASGMDGIKNKIAPPPIFQGDVYSARNLNHVPRTLRDSIEGMEKSDFVREAFGEDVIEHYLHFYRTEQSLYDNAVTTWERARYFEQI
jgi:glutamine synthetase